MPEIQSRSIPSISTCIKTRNAAKLWDDCLGVVKINGWDPTTAYSGGACHGTLSYLHPAELVRCMIPNQTIISFTHRELKLPVGWGLDQLFWKVWYLFEVFWHCKVLDVDVLGVELVYPLGNALCLLQHEKPLLAYTNLRFFLLCHNSLSQFYD